MAGNRPGPSGAPRVGESDQIPGSTSVYLMAERTPVMRLARTLDNKNWAPGAYQAVYRANLRISKEVQRVAIEKLKATIVRREQSTGKLEEAISDPQAVYADGQRIVVGVGDFLDVKASYWRPVEMGAPGLQGRVAYGFWTRAPRSDRGKVGVEGPMPGEKSGRPLILSWDVPPDDFHRNFYTWTIEHPTQAHFYFLNAWDEVGQSGFMEDTYREEFAAVIGPNGRPMSLPDTFRVYHGRPALGSDFRL